MAVTTDVALLILEAETKGFDDSRARITDLEAKLAALTAGYQGGSVTVDDYRKQGAKLAAQLDSERAALAAATAAMAKYGDTQKAVEALMGRSEAAGTKLGRSNVATGTSFGNLTTVVQQGSYALGDFASASGSLGQKLNAISNNIQFAAAGFGPWGVAVGLASVGIASLVTNWDALARAFQDKTPFPRAAADVAAMKREFDHAREAMEKLEQNASLTAGELAKYNELRARSVEIERRMTAEKERQAQLEKLRELKDVDTEKEKKERGDQLQKSLGGQQGDLGRRVAEGLNADNEARRETSRADIADLERKANRAESPEILRSILDAIRREQAILREIPTAASQQAAAEKLLADAVIGGNLDALRKLQALMLDMPGLFTQPQREAVAQATPEGRAKAKAEKAWEDSLPTREDVIGDETKEENDERERLAKQAEAARKKAEHEREAEARKKVAGVVQDYTPALKDDLTRGAAEGISRGKSDEQVKAEAVARTSAAMRTGGVDPALIAEAADRIAAEVLDDVNAKIGAGLAARASRPVQGGPRPAADRVDVATDLAVDPKALREQAAALRAEVKAIKDRYGKALADAAEATRAGNRALLDAGGPVARSEREADGLIGQGGVPGEDFALPPEALDRWLRRQMEGMFRGGRNTPRPDRHSPAAAARAAAEILDRADVQGDREKAEEAFEPTPATRAAPAPRRPTEGPPRPRREHAAVSVPEPAGFSVASVEAPEAEQPEPTPPAPSPVIVAQAAPAPAPAPPDLPEAIPGSRGADGMAGRDGIDGASLGVGGLRSLIGAAMVGLVVPAGPAGMAPGAAPAPTPTPAPEVPDLVEPTIVKPPEVAPIEAPSVPALEAPRVPDLVAPVIPAPRVPDLVAPSIEVPRVEPTRAPAPPEPEETPSFEGLEDVGFGRPEPPQPLPPWGLTDVAHYGERGLPTEPVPEPVPEPMPEPMPEPRGRVLADAPSGPTEPPPELPPPVRRITAEGFAQQRSDRKTRAAAAETPQAVGPESEPVAVAEPIEDRTRATPAVPADAPPPPPEPRSDRGRGRAIDLPEAADEEETEGAATIAPKPVVPPASPPVAPEIAGPPEPQANRRARANATDRDDRIRAEVDASDLRQADQIEAVDRAKAEDAARRSAAATEAEGRKAGPVRPVAFSAKSAYQPLPPRGPGEAPGAGSVESKINRNIIRTRAKADAKADRRNDEIARKAGASDAKKKRLAFRSRKPATAHPGERIPVAKLSRPSTRSGPSSRPSAPSPAPAPAPAPAALGPVMPILGKATAAAEGGARLAGSMLGALGVVNTRLDAVMKMQADLTARLNNPHQSRTRPGRPR